jgi:hypothetical protein
MLAPRQAGQRGLIEQRQQGKSPCVPKLGKLGSWGRPLRKSARLLAVLDDDGRRPIRQSRAWPQMRPRRPPLVTYPQSPVLVSKGAHTTPLLLVRLAPAGRLPSRHRRRYVPSLLARARRHRTADTPLYPTRRVCRCSRYRSWSYVHLGLLRSSNVPAPGQGPFSPDLDL